MSPEIRRPQFTLLDTEGRSFEFRQRTRGKATALFFGYTDCTDVCPDTLAVLAQAMGRLEPATRRNVLMVFVTEDPKHDTPRVLRRWLDQFDSSIVGLRGGNQATRSVLAQLRVSQTTRAPGSSKSVQHTGVLYLFSPDDTQTVLHTQPVQVSAIAADLAQLSHS